MNYKSNKFEGGVEIHASNIYMFFKRSIDVFLSLISLVFVIPIVFILCIIVRIDSKGNPLFIQKRVGLNGKEFNMYKIRSMRIDAEANGIQWAEQNDSRVTKVGHFIRNTRLDELPQIFNILKGDMTLIGPRPEREFFYNEFKKDLPHFHERVLVKPGLTGYAQVNGGYDISPKEKLKLDLYYIEHMKFSLDIKIVFKTIFVIFSGEGAR